MPFAVYLLGAAIFAQGTSELLLSGLLPRISDDLRVTIPQAGLLTSGFAVGMALGAPVLAVVTLRWNRRATMLGLLAVFAAAHVAGALAPGYDMLLATRFLGAFAYAGFWVVASVTAITLAGPAARGRAMAIVAGGLTIATVVGVPAGTVIGQHLGWRAAFWAVAVLTALSAIGIATAVPDGGTADRHPTGSATPAAVVPSPPNSAAEPQPVRHHHPASDDRPRQDTKPPSPLRRELRTFRDGRIWVAYVATAMTSGSGVATFTYLGALLIGATGIPEGWVPAVLVLFGLGTVLGITAGGRVADARPFATLYTGFGGVVAAALLLAVGATDPVTTLVGSFLLAFFSMAANPAVNVLVFSLAEGAPTLAGAANITAFNVGITVGPWAAGMLIGAGFGLASVSWVSAGLAVVGIGATAVSQRLRTIRTAVTEPPEPVLTPDR